MANPHAHEPHSIFVTPIIDTAKEAVRLGAYNSWSQRAPLDLDVAPEPTLTFTRLRKEALVPVPGTVLVTLDVAASLVVRYSLEAPVQWLHADPYSDPVKCSAPFQSIVMTEDDPFILQLRGIDGQPVAHGLAEDAQYRATRALANQLGTKLLALAPGIDTAWQQPATMGANV